MFLLDRGNLNWINWEVNRLRSCKKIFLEVYLEIFSVVS